MVAINSKDYRFKRPTITEKMYQSHVMISISNDGIEIIKNRFGNLKKSMYITTAIGLLIQSYLNLDLVHELTPSAMINIPIKKDLEKAMHDVLVKHSLML